MKYKDLSAKQKTSVRLFVKKRLKVKGVLRICNKPIGSIKFKELISQYQSIYNSNPVSDYFDLTNKKLYTNTGYVYVIGNLQQGICKIGYSKNPYKRISEIQTGCPYILEIIAKFEGDINMEKRLHRKYQSLKLNGEWFMYKGKLKDNIEKQIKV